MSGPATGGPRSATVTAATDLVCYGLTFWEFRPLIERNGTIGWKILQALAKRLRAAVWVGQMGGLGPVGYLLALDAAVDLLKRRDKAR